MSQKTPAMLVVLVESARLRWFVAAIGPDSRAEPLLRSAEADLERYREMDLDDQVSFLRHRLCGVVQRGCDRLWVRQMKASHFVFVFEGLLPSDKGNLTQAVAEHFTLWMLNPPVVVYCSDEQQWQKIAGDLDAPQEDLVRSRFSELVAKQSQPEVWALSEKKSTWQPESTGGH